MSLEVKGKLTQILPVESGTSKAGKEWKKGGFVIDTGAQFNPEVCFSLFGEDKITIINSVKIGEEIEVSFNLSSREYNGKWFHNVDAWKIHKTGDVKAPTPPPIANTAPTLEVKDDEEVPF